MIDGQPIWVIVVTLVLTGGVGAGILKLAEAWISVRPAREITGSQIRLNDVGALNTAIATLSGENGRMAKRMSELEEKINNLEKALDEREARIDALEAEVEEQRRRRYELERHLDTAERRIDKLAQEMKNQGLDPGPVMGVSL